jgi:hypothetical protein
MLAVQKKIKRLDFQNRLFEYLKVHEKQRITA